MLLIVPEVTVVAAVVVTVVSPGKGILPTSVGVLENRLVLHTDTYNEPQYISSMVVYTGMNVQFHLTKTQQNLTRL